MKKGEKKVVFEPYKREVLLGSDEELVDPLITAMNEAAQETLEEERAMAGTTWKVEFGKEVKTGGSFSPLFPLVEKLIRSRQPFKVGFGHVVETRVEAGDSQSVTPDTERTPPV